MTEYYNKYLKYKAKYLNLVSIMKGGYMTAIKITLKEDPNESKKDNEDEQASAQLEKLGAKIGLQFNGNLSGTTKSYYHYITDPAAGIEARDYLLANFKGFTDITQDKSKKGGPFELEITFADLMRN